MVGWVGLAMALLLGADGSPPAGGNPEESAPELWVGHRVLEGMRDVPVYGPQETRTHAVTLVEMRRNGSRIEITEHTCKLTFDPVKGVVASFSQRTTEQLPTWHVVFQARPDNTLEPTRWITGWGTEDIDHDGHPGATVHINGSCSGDLYISNLTIVSLTSGEIRGDGTIVGSVTTQVHQRVLGTHGLCLKLFASNSDETQHGSFEYRQVSTDTTCKSLVSAR